MVQWIDVSMSRWEGPMFLTPKPMWQTLFLIACFRSQVVILSCCRAGPCAIGDGPCPVGTPSEITIGKGDSRVVVQTTSCKADVTTFCGKVYDCTNVFYDIPVFAGDELVGSERVSVACVPAIRLELWGWRVFVVSFFQFSLLSFPVGEIGDFLWWVEWIISVQEM